MSALAAVPAVLSHAVLRPAATSPTLVEAVAALVAAGWGDGGAPPEARGDTNERVQATLDALLHEAALASHGPAIVQHVLPALCTVRTPHATPQQALCPCSALPRSKGLPVQALSAQLDALQTTHAQADLCANVARLLAELTMHYLASPDAYRPGGGGGAGASVDVTAALDTALAAHVVPLLPRLAAERDPMPLYAQKILALLLSRYAPAAALQPAD